jgi:hypothetical protein
MARITVATILLVCFVCANIAIVMGAGGTTNNQPRRILEKTKQHEEKDGMVRDDDNDVERRLLKDDIQRRRLLLEQSRQLEGNGNNDTPTVAPVPKQEGGQHKKADERHKKTETESSHSSSSSGGSSSSSSHSSSSSSSPASTSDTTPPLKTSSTLHGESKAILSILSTALGVGFIVVAGVAYMHQGEKEEDEDTDHRLKGSVQKRIKTFNRYMEDIGDSSSGSGNASVGSTEKLDDSSRSNSGRGVLLGGILKTSKKKLSQKLGKGKKKKRNGSRKQRQKSVDFELDVYSHVDEDMMSVESNSGMIVV